MAAPGTVVENTLPGSSGLAAENGPVTKEAGSVGPASSTAPVQGIKNLSKVANEIVPHVMNLYQSVATESDYKIYAPNAEFEDPLMHAIGLKQVQSAFQAMPKTFSMAQALKSDVIKDLDAPSSGEIHIDLVMKYKMRPVGPTFEMPSLVRLVVQDGQVVRHEDLWHHKPLTHTGIVGKTGDMMRRANMMLTHAIMGFGGKVPADSPKSTLTPPKETAGSSSL
ncbi:hypothetical protein KFL_002720090 [Klebsormidium nitens]|uniref:SnoaL-like domain-containing protein n=1 Tax=Klebsormidium nitens TaxID=105231 RepID=A0A1Y1I5B0_KLENI|nr:hypothetical protein KFL_002720090 [Klebsormidium nitens]|eukprot:GAQ86135.1 hypothetical protein KFL_002720090 [Klebsormidium nitens]